MRGGLSTALLAITIWEGEIMAKQEMPAPTNRHDCRAVMTATCYAIGSYTTGTTEMARANIKGIDARIGCMIGSCRGNAVVEFDAD